MKRTLVTIAVVIAGIALSFLLVSVGTAIAVRTTDWGKLATGKPLNDPWAAFESGSRVLIGYIALPTILVVGFLVGLFAKRIRSLAAAAAVLPISLIASGMTPWLTLLLIFCGVAAGYASVWWSRSTSRPAAEAR